MLETCCKEREEINANTTSNWVDCIAFGSAKIFVLNYIKMKKTKIIIKTGTYEDTISTQKQIPVQGLRYAKKGKEKNWISLCLLGCHLAPGTEVEPVGIPTAGQLAKHPEVAITAISCQLGDCTPQNNTVYLKKKKNRLFHTTTCT